MIEEYHFTTGGQSGRTKSLLSYIVDGAVICSQQSVIVIQMQSLSQQVPCLSVI